MENGIATYSDQICTDARPFAPAPLPTIPALTPSSPGIFGKPAADKRATGRGQAPHAESARKKKCDKLALQRRWATEDLQAARALPQWPHHNNKADLAQRKLRRLDEQHRQECAAPL
ncbi:MAG: hypothetical protein GAK35_03234 [Herbaspirillum frisingense]|uniref:Uncharacterized protein n=1 Tax=Herbaspirillum frisingense TaxID=92645 RepID=A0A7V8FUL6_9BURK|nr:MAG: hypothetical protein GAK35_03234 [Herbaspirillum frisingense]